MADTFRGDARALDQAGLDDATDQLGVREADVWTVVGVETAGAGFGADRRPKILFERHHFSRATGGVYDATHPRVSSPAAGGYTADEYARLDEAVALDRTAALESTSWGLGQILGSNHAAAGYRDVGAMVDAMCAGEADQLGAMARFMVSKELHKALKRHDWAAFARGYNGAAYKKNQYDVRLAATYAAVQKAPPAVDVRAAQVYLSFLGLYPRRIDGVIGKFTRDAIRQFQAREGMPANERVTRSLLDLLVLRVRGGGQAAPADGVPTAIPAPA